MSIRDQYDQLDKKSKNTVRIIGATVAEYLERPGEARPQPAEWKLRVVGPPEVQYIGRSEVWLVPCEVVGE